MGWIYRKKEASDLFEREKKEFLYEKGAWVTTPGTTPFQDVIRQAVKRFRNAIKELPK